jgi:drug/metabolite transporter (DMT)-like permease
MLTIGFGWWLLNENISFEQMTGAALVVAGILIVSHGSRKARHAG